MGNYFYSSESSSIHNIGIDFCGGVEMSNFGGSSWVVGTMKMGTRMHEEFSANREHPIKLRTYRRKLDNSTIRGCPDDYQCDGDSISLIEMFTTSYTHGTFESKILQLQMYMWLIEPFLKRNGYHLSGGGWVIVFDQETKHRIDTIDVKYNPEIEDRIRERVHGRKSVRISDIARIK